MLSLLSWERGLKLTTAMTAQTQQIVAPLVGAWIEILAIAVEGEPDLSSLLSWERGLKSLCQSLMVLTRN